MRIDNTVPKKAMAESIVHVLWLKGLVSSEEKNILTEKAIKKCNTKSTRLDQGGRI